MAFYIMLVKESEDEQGVIYNLGDDPEHFGKIHLDKSNGMIKEIKGIPNQHSDLMLTRAGVKLRQHWKMGDFPDRTCWAS